MPAPTIDPLILSFYRDRYREGERLTRSAHGRIEYLRTQELLRRFLPAPPAAVLDVGGGTGVHARWLSEDGYAVHLIDPVPEHVEQARRHGGFRADLGDARALPHPDGSFEAALLLGPLYHLVEASDRRSALTEARRVTRTGGLVVAAAINRYAPLLELAATGDIDDDSEAELRSLLADGQHADDPDGFTTAYFHHHEELAEELREVGLQDVTVLGLEGPTTPALDRAAPDELEALLPSALRCARMLESDPALIAASPHLLAIGRCP